MWNRIKNLKKRWIALLVLIIGLIVFRIFLPTIVKNYVNKVLANIPGYHGSITDIDIALYRGAYIIKGLNLVNTNGKSGIPLMNFPRNDISVQWKALFSGNVVAEIFLYGPELNYVVEDMTTNGADDDDWTKAITDLIPIDINHFVIEDGKIAYIELAADPKIDLSVRDFDFSADNLRNVIEAERTLPSPFTGSGISVGNGKLTIDGKANLLKQIPDADLNVKLERTNLSAFNDVANSFAKMDFESGDVDAYSEIALADGNLTGYFKVLFEDVKFHSEDDSFLETIWETIGAFFEFILTNRSTKNFAVKAPIQGNIENLSVSTWPTIGSILKNAFIKGLREGIDEEVDYQDALGGEIEDLKDQKDSLKWFQFKKKKEIKEEIEELKEDDDSLKNSSDLEKEEQKEIDKALEEKEMENEKLMKELEKEREKREKELKKQREKLDKNN